MPNSSLHHILYVEDDEALARLLQKRMERQRFHIDLAATAEEGLRCLQDFAYDLVLIDYNLPGMSGIEMLDVISTLENPPPTIILTASGDERIALNALEKGATDYAVKDTGQTYLDLLPAVMQAAFTREKLLRENERQRRELELAVEKAEAANEAKSNFLATMSHEIRTPMNVVTGLASILARTPLNEEQKKIVSTLQNNANLLLKIINDLLDISRIESGQVELEYSQFTIASILDDIHIMFGDQIKARKLQYTVTDNTSEQEFRGDRTRIQQIIMNLVSNAIKFTENGSITLAADRVHTPEGKIELILTVSDTGIGIPEKKLSTIFEKFTQGDETITRRFGGSGLGLSIAQSLAQLMQGEITVTTRENQGSTFHVRLILEEVGYDASHIVSLASTFTEKESKSKGKILVVEDYAPNIMVATMILEELGFEVVSCESGEEAIKIIAQSTRAFFAVLMDVQMHHMDGLETTGHIRELEKKLGFRNTIIGVTAHALAGDRSRCISAGMDDYVSKPIHPEILEQKLLALSLESQ